VSEIDLKYMSTASDTAMSSVGIVAGQTEDNYTFYFLIQYL